jgi:uncharacterized delta-60 repeat protein
MKNKILRLTTHYFFFCLFVSPAFAQQIDSSFNINGRVITPIGNASDRGIDMTIDNNDRVVMAGQTFNGVDNDMALVRYNTDGSPDRSFGNNGIVVTPIGNGNDYSDGVAIQTDGKIVVCGYFDDGATLLSIVLLRYNEDGTLDPAFDGDGIVKFNVSERDDLARDVKIQPDGKIVITGFAFNGSDNDILFARFNADGSPDLSFNQTGFRLLPVGSSNDATFQLVLQPDNKILAAGYIITFDLSKNIVIVRLQPDGSLDNSFGNAGISLSAWADPIYPNFDAAYSIALQGDKILLGGYARGLFFDVDNYIAVARYTESGLLDSSFGSNGVFKTIFGPVDNELSENVTALAVQADGKIVASANSSIIGYNADFLMFRLDVNGTLDNSFGGNGFVSTTLSLGDDLAGSVAIQSDGKIVLAGYSFDSTRDYDFAAVRYLSDGGGCSTPPNIITSSVSDRSATVRWKPLPKRGVNYKIRYRVKNSRSLQVVSAGETSSRRLTSLKPDTQYEWQVQADCGASVSSYSLMGTFRTSKVAFTGSEYAKSSINKAGVEVYPNPATSYITVKFSATKQSVYDISLFDLQGKVLLQVQSVSAPGANTQTLDVSKLAAGTYTLQVKHNNTVSIQKVVKQ